MLKMVINTLEKTFDVDAFSIQLRETSIYYK